MALARATHWTKRALAPPWHSVTPPNSLCGPQSTQGNDPWRYRRGRSPGPACSVGEFSTGPPVGGAAGAVALRLS